MSWTAGVASITMPSLPLLESSSSLAFACSAIPSCATTRWTMCSSGLTSSVSERSAPKRSLKASTSLPSPPMGICPPAPPPSPVPVMADRR